MATERIQIGILHPALTRRRFLHVVGAGGLAAMARPAAAQPKAYWAHGASIDHHNIPVYVGLAKGVWKEEGLDLTARVFEGGGPMVQAMVAGQLPIGTGGIATLMNARAGGLKVKYIATIEGMPTGWGIVAVDPAITSVKDLKGKKIGTGRAGAISHWWGQQVGRWQNWTPGQDVQLVAVGGASALQGALLSRQVDAILVWPPGFPLLRSKMKEAHVVVAMNDVVKHHLGAYESEGWFATEKYIETESDVIRRTLRGYVRATRYCVEHRDEAAEIAAKEWSVAPAVAREVIDENLPDFSLTGVPNEKGIQVVVKSLVEMGTLKQDLRLDEVLDRRFLPIKT